jgi:hypothetical protein
MRRREFIALLNGRDSLAATLCGRGKASSGMRANLKITEGEPSYRR